MALKNDLLLRTIRGEQTERTPVWLMRQAGRILPEYRAVRASLSGFRELVETPERAAEVTIQPVDLLGVDAAIIFSDILVIPDAMGLPYRMEKGIGPVFDNTVRSEAQRAALDNAPDVADRLSYVFEALRLTKKELDGRVPLIGFAGAPWTIFCYMTEGGGSKTFSYPRRLLYTEPEMAHRLLSDITEVTIAYLKLQIQAGADVVQVFDSWAGVLSADVYRAFALPYLQRICDAIQEVPVTVFSKGAYGSLADLGQLDCQTVGLDWNMDIAEARQQVGAGKTLQGNLDPTVLYADYETIRKHTRAMLAGFGPNRHIANLGHGVYPDTNPDHVRCFIDAVKTFENQ